MAREYKPEFGKKSLFALENTLVDNVALVEDDFLEKFQLKKGDFNSTSDTEKINALIKELNNVDVEFGGSAANTACGYANLGLPASFAGSIGNDDNGIGFRNSLLSSNVKPYLAPRENKNGVCYVLITPEGERTFLVYMGASSDIKPSDLPVKDIASSGFLHSTAYALDSISDALDTALDIALKNRVRVSFDVASTTSITRHRAKLDEVLKKTDILFINKEEAMAFGFREDEIAKVIPYLQNTYGIGLVALKLGSEGAIISSGKTMAKVMSFKVDIANTNGAGDGFAAGLLYGIANGYDLFKSGKIAAYYASRVVMQHPTRLNYKLINIEGMAD